MAKLTNAQQIAGAKSTSQSKAMNAALSKSSARGFPGLGGKAKAPSAKPPKKYGALVPNKNDKGRAKPPKNKGKLGSLLKSGGSFTTNYSV